MTVYDFNDRNKDCITSLDQIKIFLLLIYFNGVVSH